MTHVATLNFYQSRNLARAASILLLKKEIRKRSFPFILLFKAIYFINKSSIKLKGIYFKYYQMETRQLKRNCPISKKAQPIANMVSTQGKKKAKTTAIAKKSTNKKGKKEIVKAPKEGKKSKSKHALQLPTSIAQNGKWTEDEHKLFLEALEKYGNCWKLVEQFIGTRSCAQIRSHAQKYFRKLRKKHSRGAQEQESAKKQSLHCHQRVLQLCQLPYSVQVECSTTAYN
eukprot:TRINITY_DN2968_c0_g1_i2.p1 TRINITY_DN2968_c0_g1~~TRINITY_DN2968_c0_g1_i2.p1  ORF type:complete len:229 (+),score=27.58 TRINITY_DN2968_c0_g1_i2:112-798(+)